MLSVSSYCFLLVTRMSIISLHVSSFSLGFIRNYTVITNIFLPFSSFELF